MARPLPPDISYGLECAVECFDTTADVITFYHRFNEDVDIVRAVDETDHNCTPDGVQDSLRKLARIYYSGYNKWFHTSAQPEQQAWCISSATADYGRKSAEQIDSLIHYYVSDVLFEGGDPAKRDNQDRWIEANRAIQHGRKITAMAAHKASMIDHDLLYDAVFNPVDFFDRLPMTPAANQCLFGAPGTDVRWEEDEDERPWRRLITLKKPSARDAKLARKKRMSVLKKSANFLSKLIGAEQVAMFVTGREITVRGNKYTFSIKKNSILANDHGALRISVIDNITDKRIFNLCWYVDKTPALDQISALVMAVRVGDEDEILRVGNFMQVNYDAIVGHEHLKGLVTAPAHYGLNFEPDADGNCANPYDPTNDLVAREQRERMFGDEDRMFRHTRGTTEWYRSHPDTYLDFARRIAKRWQARHMPDVIASLMVPHAPQTVRPFVDGRVGRELLPEPQRHEILAPAINRDQIVDGANAVVRMLAA